MCAQKKSLLQLKFDGEAIKDGRMLFYDLSIFLSNISLAINRIVNKLTIGESVKIGRPLKENQTLSVLEIVSLKQGSFLLELDIRRNGHQFPGWDPREEAVHELMDSIKAMEDGSFIQPTESCDYGVLKALRDAGKIMDRGIDVININSYTHFGSERVKYTPSVRKQIEANIEKCEYTLTSIEGRLVMLDMQEDKLRCRLQPSIGEPFYCSFGEDLSGDIGRYLLKFVRVRGEATIDKNTDRITNFKIEDVEPVNEEEGLPTLPLTSFWVGKTFEQLASEQGVHPVDDLGKLTNDWPEGEDFEEFIAAIRSMDN